MKALVRELAAVVGEENVTTDERERDFLSQDVFTRERCAAVVAAPNNVEELAAVVGKAVAAGVSVVPRGGGMSYTSGYVPAETGALLLDLRRMNRVLAIERDDMYVRVEAGTTWQALHSVLREEGLRTPCWGTLSGRYATIGGSLSQNSIFWGSGRHGSAADSVLSLDVVIADGTVLSTGAAAQRNARPFFRYFGPDLTGLFIGDGGALGVKGTATLRLLPDALERAFGSFAFEGYREMAAAMSEVARRDLASECFGFDPYLQSQRMKRESLARDASQFASLLKSAGGAGRAVRQGAKAALAGRRFMENVKWSFHVICEERTKEAAAAARRRVSDIARTHGGRELPDSIPRIVGANPFGPVNSMLGPAGERWVPVHGLLPHTLAPKAIAEIEALFEHRAEDFASHGIRTGCLLATVRTNCFVVEPMFFWPDAIEEIHRRSVEPEHLQRITEFPANPDARSLVSGVRDELADLFSRLGAVHLQIGKTYRYREALRPEPLALVRELKRVLDPNRRMNPGCLGL